MKKRQMGFTVSKVVIAVVVGLFTIALASHYTQANEPVINTEYLQKYNQVKKLNGYTITLKYGAYSDKTKTGLCVFEVEKDNGKMEMPTIFDDNIIDFFGDKEKPIRIGMDASGTIDSRAVVKGNKLIIYSNFEAHLDPKGIDSFYKHQVYLKYGDKSGSKADINCVNEYGFKLEDNVSGKEYKVDDTTTLSLSYFGFSIESDHKWKDLKVEIEDKNKKETLIDSKKSDGNYSQFSSRDEGYQKYDYVYTFDDINFDIDKIEAVYVNGKKLTD